MATPAAAPASLAAPRRYATRGVLEIGGQAALSYTRDFEARYDALSLYLVGTLGVFPLRAFILGVSFGVSYSRTEYTGSPLAYWSSGLSLGLHPGVVLPLGTRFFFYGQALLGLDWSTQAFSQTADVIVGLFGAEVGIKLPVGPSTLVSLGLRPHYRVGKRQVESPSTGSLSVDESQFQLLFTLGFSWFR